MMKNLKNDFSKNVKFCNFLHFLSVNFFQVGNHIFGHIRPTGITIPQIKAKDISFGPYSFKSLAKINIF